MEKFSYGIMVLNPSLANDDGIPIVHFVGYWDEPTQSDIDSVKMELETDEEFGLIEDAKSGKLAYYPAPQDIIGIYYNAVLNHE